MRDDEGVPEGAEYPIKFGDNIVPEKTNTYKLTDFKDATNHSRIGKEVTKAKEYLKKDAIEEKLMKQYGYSTRVALLEKVSNAVIPEGELRVAFRCARFPKTKKGKLILSSINAYKMTVAAGKGRGGRGSGGRGAGTTTHVRQPIEISVDREEFEAMINNFNAAHDMNPPPRAQVDGADDDNDWVCEREGDTQADILKREGLTNWARSMTMLEDLEMYALGSSAARADSTDPAAQLKAKLKEINKAKVDYAEKLHQKMEKEKEKKARPPSHPPPFLPPSLPFLPPVAHTLTGAASDCLRPTCLCGRRKRRRRRSA